MKKLLFALFAAAALLPFSVSCDSGANEPDAPIPADTLPQVTPPRPEAAGTRLRSHSRRSRTGRLHALHWPGRTTFRRLPPDIC